MTHDTYIRFIQLIIRYSNEDEVKSELMIKKSKTILMNKFLCDTIEIKHIHDISFLFHIFNEPYSSTYI